MGRSQNGASRSGSWSAGVLAGELAFTICSSCSEMEMAGLPCFLCFCMSLEGGLHQISPEVMSEGRVRSFSLAHIRAGGFGRCPQIKNPTGPCLRMTFSASFGKILGLSPAALHMAQALFQLPRSTGDSSSFSTLQSLLCRAKIGDSDRQAPEKGERGETLARPLGQAKHMHS